PQPPPLPSNPSPFPDWRNKRFSFSYRLKPTTTAAARVPCRLSLPRSYMFKGRESEY
ncbi:hypothetical protein LINPERHAP1_LOCUS25210, partial [Linum perenne]